VDNKGLSFHDVNELIGKLRHHKIVKMGVMVGDDGLRDTKPSDDMIEYELCCIFPSVIECRHRLYPLSEIIHNYNDVSMPLD
jgi:hypothetical protein